MTPKYKRGVMQSVKHHTSLSFQNLLRMVFCVHLLDDFREDSVLVEDEGPAEGPHHCLSVHLLLSPCSEGLEHLCGSIGQ